jgi:hypothetical protein
MPVDDLRRKPIISVNIVRSQEEEVVDGRVKLLTSISHMAIPCCLGVG